MVSGERGNNKFPFYLKLDFTIMIWYSCFVWGDLLMKKILVLVIAALLLTGCSNNKAPDSTIETSGGVMALDGQLWIFPE